jgi:hypothetical protein
MPQETPKQKLKPFRFQDGRWVVTVRARTIADARVKASEKLDQRSAKFMAKPPECGWTLRLLIRTTKG